MFENLDYEPLKDYRKLYQYLKKRLCADKMMYIFLDEIQEVESFEKVVDSLLTFLSYNEKKKETRKEWAKMLAFENQNIEFKQEYVPDILLNRNE